MRVPRYDGPQVESTNLRGNYSDGGISAKTFGADIAQGLGAFAVVAKDMHREAQAEADESALLGFDNDMATIETELLHNPETGAYTRQGSEAFDLEEKVLPDWDKRQSEAIGKLPGRLRAHAENLAMRRRTDAQRGIMRHTMQQAELYGKQQAEAKVANDTNVGILNYQDDTRLGEVMAGIEVATDKLVRGAPPELRQLAIEKARSNLYSGVVGRYLQDGAIAGEQALAKYGRFLTADSLVELEGKIRPLVNARNDEAEYKQLVETGDAVGVAAPGKRGNPPPEIAQILTSAAAKYGIPPEYLFALAEQESGFNPKAVNKEVIDGNDNAAGLLQWSAASARDWGVHDRLDPVQSADAAARRFAQNMKAHGADFAIAAHFGGEGGAAAVVQRGRTADNPKTAAYLAQVRARASRWRGNVSTPVAEGAVPPAPPRSEVEAMRVIEAKYAHDPVKRERMLALARRDWAMRDAEERDRERSVHESVYQKIYTADPRASFDSLLSNVERDQLIKSGNYDAFESELTRRATGKTKQSDPALVYALEREAVLSPDTFAKRNILRSVEQLDNADLSRLLKLQADFNDPTKRNAAQADWATEDQRISRGATMLGFDGEKKKAERQAFASFYRLAEQSFIQAHGGKKPDGAQADALLRNAVQSFAADPARRVAGVAAAEKLAMGQELEDAQGNPVRLTETDRAVVVGVLKQRGIARPTEAQILETAGKFFTGAAQ